MGMQEFGFIIQKFCEKSGIDDVKDVYSGYPIMVDDTLVELSYAGYLDALRLRIDLGMPDIKSESIIHKSILELNNDVDSDEKCQAIYGLDSETGSITMTWHIKLDDLDGEADLANLISSDVPEMLSQWKEFTENLRPGTEDDNPLIFRAR